jgi:hypothetical protein
VCLSKEQVFWTRKLPIVLTAFSQFVAQYFDLSEYSLLRRRAFLT